MLKWIVERLEGPAEAVDTPIGVAADAGVARPRRPGPLATADLDLLLTVDAEIWRQEAALIPAHFESFGEHTPTELWDEYRALVKRLG